MAHPNHLNCPAMPGMTMEANSSARSTLVSGSMHCVQQSEWGNPWLCSHTPSRHRPALKWERKINFQHFHWRFGEIAPSLAICPVEKSRKPSRYSSCLLLPSLFAFAAPFFFTTAGPSGKTYSNGIVSIFRAESSPDVVNTPCNQAHWLTNPAFVSLKRESWC